MRTFCPPLGQPSTPPGSFLFHLRIPTHWFRPHLGVFLPGRVPKVSLGRRDGLGCLQWRRGVHVRFDPGGPSSSHVSNSCVVHTYLPFGNGFFGLYSIVAGWLFRQVALFRAFDLAGTVRGTKFRRSAHALFHLAICTHPPHCIPFASPFSSETSAGRRRLHRAFHGSNPWESSRRHCLGSVRGSQGQPFFLFSSVVSSFFHLFLRMHLRHVLVPSSHPSGSPSPAHLHRRLLRTISSSFRPFDLPFKVSFQSRVTPFKCLGRKETDPRTKRGRSRKSEWETLPFSSSDYSDFDWETSFQSK